MSTRHFVCRRTGWLIVAGLVVVGGISLFAAEPQKPGDGKPDGKPDAKAEKPDDKKRPVPKPELAPKDVVKIVVEALRDNDAKDGGIATAFEFASPGNRKTTGPLERFIPMVKTPGYKPLLNHKGAKYSKVKTGEDDDATQFVLITADDGKEFLYLFSLSKQKDGEFAGCWMTDGVVNVTDSVAPPDDEPAHEKPLKPDRA